MHPCLSVDEILRIIARELVNSGGKGAAVSLACCCRSLEDPVLDALWAIQVRLVCLFKCLPKDVWNGDGCIVSVQEYATLPFNGSIRKSFRRLPTAAEWTRFQQYARRMRELKHRNSSPTTPSAAVLSALQFRATNEPLLPNLVSLSFLRIQESFIPFIKLFLSPRTTSVYIGFGSIPSSEAIASLITTLPTRCHNLQEVSLRSLPKDPAITAAVSKMLLVTNRNTLQQLRVSSSLTEEASTVLYRLPTLCDLSVDIERGTSLPSASLPNLTNLSILCDDESSWPELFRGATFGKLESVTLYIRFEPIREFLGAFERVALSSSVQNTLLKLHLVPLYSWNPNYSSLQAFTQLEILKIDFSCGNRCSSTVDDDIIIHFSRAMPKLSVLKLGREPCRQLTGGVTANGLMALARHCPRLSALRVHLQVDSLSTLPASPGAAPDGESTTPPVDCALADLEVGMIPLPEGSVSMVAQTLLHIFPRIEAIDGHDEMWGRVEDQISYLRRASGCEGS